MDTGAPQTQHKGWTKRELVGTGYLIGDGAMFANGMLKAMAYHRNAESGVPANYTGAVKTKEEWMTARNAAVRESVTGLVWGIGGVAMAKYGNRPLHEQQEALEHRLAAHFKEQGITLSEDLLAKALAEKNKSFFQKIEDFCYRYPTEILNVVYGGMSLLTLVYDGLTKELQPKLKEGKTFSFTKSPDTFQLRDISSLGMGVTIVAGALCGLLIKEKSKEQLDEAGATGFSRWIQEKPMRATGAFYLANNYFTYENMMGNKAEFSTDPNSMFKNMWTLRAATLGTYMFGNITLMGTATGAQKIDQPTEEAKRKVLETSARVILMQPPEVQQELLRATAGYLTHQRELGFSRHTVKRVEEMLTGALQEYQKGSAISDTQGAPQGSGNSWAGKVTEAENKPDTARLI